MDSIGPQCTPLKQEYETCFNRWYTEKFLKGDTSTECDELFKKYRACVMGAIKEKGVDSLLSEAQKDSASFFSKPTTFSERPKSESSS
ncbi:Mitochondrial distribution and morphology protein 35 [Sorochytrium milnesiophthora]